MSIPCKFEHSVLSYEEHEIVLRNHHPGIYDAGLDDLKKLRQRLRAEAALPRIQDGTEPIEIVARKVGFGDKDRMRRAFLRIYGQPPRALRRATAASKSRARALPEAPELA